MLPKESGFSQKPAPLQLKGYLSAKTVYLRVQSVSSSLTNFYEIA